MIVEKYTYNKPLKLMILKVSRLSGVVRHTVVKAEEI